MTMEIADHCPSGGSASQSPEITSPQQHPHNNNTRYQEDNNNNTKRNGGCGADLGSLEYRDNVFFKKVKEKAKQKSMRQGVQQNYDNLVKLVPVLKNRTKKTTLTKSMILKSTVQYINMLKEDSLSSTFHLNEELRVERDRNTRLQKELDVWADKVHKLRKKHEIQDNKKGQEQQNHQ